MLKVYLSLIVVFASLVSDSVVADEAGAQWASDGAMYAGRIGGNHLYDRTARAEARTWDEATALCATLGDRWHLPTRVELAVLRDAPVERITGNVGGGAWHWSSSLTDFGEQSLAWAQNLADGQGGYASLGNRFAATCARLEPQPEGPPANDRY